jgi:putative hydrolase
MTLSSVRLDADYHVHSTFSDDAVSTLEENLAAAIAAGLTTVRFIDHVRASTPWVGEFVAAVAALTVPSGMRVLTGVETKIMDVDGTIDVPDEILSGALHVDAIVMADHQFPGPDGPWSPEYTAQQLAAGLSVSVALDQLIDAYVAAMIRFPAGQLAHPFSILPKVGLSESQLTDPQLQRWATTAAATGTVIEVNEKWACPSPRTLAAAFAAGATVVAATDSHVAADVGSYSRVSALLGEVHG